MKNLDFEWLTDEFMLYCRSTQLREKTMSSYEQTLHLFGRWLSDELKIYIVDVLAQFFKLLAFNIASSLGFALSHLNLLNVPVCVHNNFLQIMLFVCRSRKLRPKTMISCEQKRIWRKISTYLCGFVGIP